MLFHVLVRIREPGVVSTSIVKQGELAMAG
jgi:hypothetical protein